MRTADMKSRDLPFETDAMRRIFGISVMVLALYLLLITQFGKTARSKENHFNLAKDFGFYGVTTLGVGVLIVSGGIDLSIGSLVGLSAVVFGLLLLMLAFRPTGLVAEKREEDVT